MTDKVKERKNQIEQYLKDSMEHQNKNINYILFNPNSEDIIVFASDLQEEMIMVDSKDNITNIPEWDFSFNEYLYEYLQNGYELELMEDNVHLGVWKDIESYYPEDISNKDGVQKYLIYCIDNNITKDYLNKNLNADIDNVLEKLENYEDNDLFDYKGFRIEVVDNNYDNPSEKIVNIYENEQMYIDGKVLDTISLDSKGLRIYVQEYIDENFIIPKDKENEINYFSFVLGYDLLNDKLKNSNNSECDISYDICQKLANRFILSNEYHNFKESSYTMLEQWVNNNQSLINSYINENEKETQEMDKSELVKSKYPIGTRIKLINMTDDYAVPSGTCGTVEYVDDQGQIGMKWDNGRTLSLIYGVDTFEIINENKKAMFHTKIASDMKYNGEIVEILEYKKGKDIYSDRYTVKFNDGTINDNIMRNELNFNYGKKKDERGR